MGRFVNIEKDFNTNAGQNLLCADQHGDVPNEVVLQNV